MSLFKRKKVPAADLAGGSADGVFEVVGPQGVMRYTPDDFEEIFTTVDEHEMRRHVELGWVLLDEVVGPGEGPGHEELATRPTSAGGGGGMSWRTVPVRVGPDDVTTYVLGYLKQGSMGEPREGS